MSAKATSPRFAECQMGRVVFSLMVVCLDVDGGLGSPLNRHASLKTKEAKELNPPPPQQQQQQNRPRLLAAQNCVFGCLGDAELDHPFCSNLDGLAGCRISTRSE